MKLQVGSRVEALKDGVRGTILRFDLKGMPVIAFEDGWTGSVARKTVRAALEPKP